MKVELGMILHTFASKHDIWTLVPNLLTLKFAKKCADAADVDEKAHHKFQECMEFLV